MKSKKTNKANLEKSKPTLLLIGLVLSLAVVLESFEWLGTDYMSSSIESSLSAEITPENIIEIDLLVPKKKTVIQPKKTKPNVVTVVKKPIAAGPVVISKKQQTLDVDWDALDNGDKDDDIEIIVVDPIFTVVEDMPEFPGGEKALYAFLGKNIKYPSISAEAGSQGRAYINFTIEKDGTITDVKTIGGTADKRCKKEAERVVGEMPKWKPGKQRGKKVRVSYTLPVRFVLAN